MDSSKELEAEYCFYTESGDGCEHLADLGNSSAYCRNYKRQIFISSKTNEPIRCESCKSRKAIKTERVPKLEYRGYIPPDILVALTDNRTLNEAQKAVDDYQRTCLAEYKMRLGS